MRKEEFVEHNEAPIYKWVIDENGKVTKLPPITCYKVSNFPRYKYYFFRTEGKPSVQCVRSLQFDVCTAKCYFSMDGDDSKAMAKIEAHMKARYEETKKNFERAEKRWKGFKELN